MNFEHLIIGGCYRSGTSIVTVMLAKHSQVLLTNELWNYRSLDVVNTKLQNLSNKYPYIGDNTSTIARDTLGDNFRGFLDSFDRDKITSIYDLYSRLIKFSNKYPRYCGDKVPEYILDIENITKIYSNSRLIVCIRDGRDVIESQIKRYKYFMDINGTVRNHWWTKRTIEDCINDTGRNWLHYMNVWDITKKNLKVPYYELFYKNLILNPEDEAERLSKFLNIEELELFKIFKSNINSDTYNSWKYTIPNINSKLPSAWKQMLKKYGFEV